MSGTGRSERECFPKITTDAMKKNRMRTAVIIAGVVVCATMMQASFLREPGFLADSRATEGDCSAMRTQPISSTKDKHYDGGQPRHERYIEHRVREGFRDRRTTINRICIFPVTRKHVCTAAINIVGKRARTSKELVVSECCSDGGVRYRIGQGKT